MVRFPGVGPDLVGEAGDAAPQLAQARGEIALGAALVHVRVPPADIDEAERVVGLHQPADAARGELEAFGRDSALVGRHHFGGHRSVHLVTHGEALRDGGAEGLARIHLLDQLRLPAVYAGLSYGAQADVRHAGCASEDQRQLVGEGERLRAMQLAVQPGHEGGVVVARAVQCLAELNGVLRLKVAARQVVGAREGDEGDLLLLPQWIDRVLERRVEAPLRVQRKRAVGIGGIGLLDRQRRARAVVKLAGDRDHNVGRVVGAAQEDHQQALPSRIRRGEYLACGHQRSRGEGGSHHFASVHGDLFQRCMNSGDDR